MAYKYKSANENSIIILEPIEKEGFYAYILLCADGTFYTGWTVNIAKRIEAHNSGSGSKYTSTRLPVVLVYYEEFDNKREAMSREWHIKKLSRERKEKLIKRAQGLIRTSSHLISV